MNETLERSTQGALPCAISGESTPAPAAGEKTERSLAERRKAYDEFILANKDFYTEDTGRMINRRFREAKLTEERLAAANAELEKYKSRTPSEPSAEFLGAHPDFELDRELENDDFRHLCECGIDTELAYAVVHFDELRRTAQLEAEKAAIKAASDTLRARGGRIREGASYPGTGAALRTDPSKLTKAERASLARRAELGESITF